MINLAGTWTLRDAQGEFDLTMSLPGDVHSTLTAAGLIPEPYAGRNEYDVRWVADRDWTLSRRFSCDGSGPMWLELSELDTVATVRINGQMVLEADNQHRLYRLAVGHAVKPGENEIEITIHACLDEARRRYESLPFPVPYSTDNNPLPHGNMLRKVQCDFGWDWNIALAPLGVHGHVRLVEDTGLTIDRVVPVQTHADGDVRLDIAVHVTADADGVQDWSCRLAAPDGTEQQIEGRADLRRGVQVLDLVLEVDTPALWWPAGQGDQPLYGLEVAVGQERDCRRIGLRDITLITTPDAVGARFALSVNGREIFCKGANWIPADALPGRITAEGIADLLDSAVAANMNMIRVWGGGRYESDTFYDACDERGLLVWQDFMFACSLYPSTDGFLASVAAEVRDQVGRLNHRASIALWCGDNELLGALTWFEEPLKDRDRYLVSYDRLNRTIETALKETAPDAIWWPSSPSPGLLSFGDAWHNDSSGDMHFWSVWHEGKSFDAYRAVRPRFCSEFGFQSFPSMDVVRRFAEPADRNIASPVLESHQKNAGGNARIAETMFRYFRFPTRFDDFVYVSQVQQAEAIRTAVDGWRALKPHCMGTLYWQLNDTWPVASWASLDHGGGWKLLHHAARHFYAPLTAVVLPEDGRYRVVAVSDLPAPAEISVEVFALSMSGGMRSLAMLTATVPTDRADEIGHVPADALGSDEVLVARVTSAHAPERLVVEAPRPFKGYDLPDPDIRTDVAADGDGWAITLTAARPAFFVAIEPGQAGRLSDNMLTLLPDRPVTVHFAPSAAGDAPVPTIRSLYSATCQTEQEIA
ncbi:beta-mannosidase [Oceanomicrobium pacificus]|uniref:beta-mannosidase n=1 Tax=Oceanomicrobium pacificus TaxID=2692916 RepID=A0A6B0TW81_9RHOB|nr:glycoside hydrolase family 2 protein [Oceanomicrobium pacificus]MXU65995.1 glycoside hydrolase family 2 protein [Oceanomicrobium pacificus]